MGIDRLLTSSDKQKVNEHILNSYASFNPHFDKASLFLVNGTGIFLKLFYICPVAYFAQIWRK